MSDLLAVLAASWGLLMALAPVLQIRRMLARRSSADVSLTYVGVLLIGFVLWIAYGVSLQNVAIIVPNSVALAVGLVTIGIAWRLRHGRSGEGAEVSSRSPSPSANPGAGPAPGR